MSGWPLRACFSTVGLTSTCAAWRHTSRPCTPLHGVYTGFLAVAVVIGLGYGRRRAAGYVGWRAVRAGYELATLGMLIFIVGGLGDMLWDRLLTIEANLEALFSPTHLRSVGREYDVACLAQAPMLAGVLLHTGALVSAVLLSLRRARDSVSTC
jgi:hypothetical protein